MSHRTLAFLAALLTSCAPTVKAPRPVEPPPANEHPFDRIGRLLAEPQTAAHRFLRQRPDPHNPAPEPDQIARRFKDAEALAKRHGFDGIEDYLGAYAAMRMYMDYHARQTRWKETRRELARSLEKVNAALADPALSPYARDLQRLTLEHIRDETARLDEEEQRFSAPLDEADARAWERNREVFEEAEGRP
jgi:hypothetical protein